jgi:hypothetical protein
MQLQAGCQNQSTPATGNTEDPEPSGPTPEKASRGTFDADLLEYVTRGQTTAG